MGGQPPEVIQHTVFGRVQVLQKGSGKVFRARLPVLDQYEAARYTEGLDLAKSFRCKYLYLPLEQSFEKAGLCGNSGSMLLHYEDYRDNLTQDVLKRGFESKPYSQEELLLYLYNLVDAARNFQVNKLKMGNIHGDSVLLPHEGQQDIRIVNRYTKPNEPVGIQKIVESSRGSYVAPEQLEELRKKVIYELKEDYGKKDAFGIGMLLLELGTLKSSEQLYDFYKLKVDVNSSKFIERVQEFEERYPSPLLNNLLVSVIEASESKRLSVGEIHAILQPYQKQIRSRRPFAVGPEEVRNTLRKYNESLPHLH